MKLSLKGESAFVEGFSAAVDVVNVDPTREAINDLLSEVSQDDVGVSRWFGFWEGAGEPEMVVLKQTRHRIWRRFLRACV